MKVCEIRRDGDIIRVDDASFSTADDAYKLFRNLYNKALGKANYSKLGHSGVRTSRITATGIVFTPEYLSILRRRYIGVPRVRCYLMGLIGSSYCKIVGCYDLKEFSTEEETERYLDWVFSKDSGLLRQYDRRNHLGRTNIKQKIQWKTQNRTR